MGWLYIVVRTFPFWAIPTALFLFGAFLRAKPKTKHGKIFRLMYLLISIILVVGSGLYLYFKGHAHAVPLLYQILNPDKVD